MTDKTTRPEIRNAAGRKTKKETLMRFLFEYRCEQDVPEEMMLLLSLIEVYTRGKEDPSW